MRAVCGLAMWKLGSQSALSDRAEQLTPLSLFDPSSPQRGGNIACHQQLSHQCKLNLVRSPHEALFLDLTGRLGESATMQPLPVPVPTTLHCHVTRTVMGIQNIRTLVISNQVLKRSRMRQNA
jgi:hypothetical protein